MYIPKFGSFEELDSLFVNPSAEQPLAQSKLGRHTAHRQVTKGTGSFSVDG